MYDPQRIGPDHAHAFDPRVVESIARETAAPIDIVSRIYREELDALASEARIVQFLQVIAGRRARLRLRRH
jgi:hypothetical protein